MKAPQDKRCGVERRSGIDRRCINPGRYTGVDRRIDSDCRSSRDRRSDNAPWTELQMPRIRS
ncbi:MAG: hypothetical protein QNI89_04015 [Desulfobacterales bacterium]|nr:hypothetical protein [Desulfobacterales bacterium]MDJ0853598.1 hypothetical protein [Desulfobacterales bacterium]MDJ0886439.1 hypothetical protein [Desulfobacterales bacterium]